MWWQGSASCTVLSLLSFTRSCAPSRSFWMAAAEHTSLTSNKMWYATQASFLDAAIRSRYRRQQLRFHCLACSMNCNLKSSCHMQISCIDASALVICWHCANCWSECCNHATCITRNSEHTCLSLDTLCSHHWQTNDVLSSYKSGKFSSCRHDIVHLDHNLPIINMPTHHA